MTIQLYTMRLCQVLGSQEDLYGPCNMILVCSMTRMTGIGIGDLVENETRVTLGITST